jgi:phage anti-repressor protein
MTLDALAIVTDEARQGIDARRLHAALGIGRDFTTWIRDAVERFGFVQGRDFASAQGLRSPESGSAKAREQWATEYTLSLTAAKLIAISIRRPQALKAREALIKIEEQWNSPSAVMARAVILAHAENQRLRAEHAALLPKAEAHDRLAAAGGDLSLRRAAKALQIPEKEFVARLLCDAILFRDARGRLEPYARHIAEGRFRVRAVVIGDHDEDVTTQALVTPLGLTWLASRYPARPALQASTELVLQ